MFLAVLRMVLFAALFLAVAIVVARLLFAAPVPGTHTHTSALPPDDTGTLAKAIQQNRKGHEGLSGIAPLRDGRGAFTARILLANAAVSSIDVQYYIWRPDMTGHLLLKALHRAAERGVRVRLLLDDNGIDRLDSLLGALDTHPNIEVRLYNPFVLRRFKRLSYGFDFFRLNHRMHNKAFTVDGRASILGGRNVGDEYFGTGTTPLQIDLDVLAVGEVVPHISADFDRYWNSAPVHPARAILGEGDAGLSIKTALDAFDSDPQFEQYRALLEESDIVASLARGDLALEWTDAVLISDDPIVGTDAIVRADLFVSRLLKAVGPIESRFDGVTPYFVPGKAGVRVFAGLQESGIEMRMLTNSLEATNMLPVHAGYSKHREDLLRAGVGLFELRAQAGGPSAKEILGPLGSSGSNLHAKTFAVDGTRIFVGSFNFDPRSVTLNTEMGLLIQSTAMAEALHSAFDEGLSDLAWRVELQDRKPVWIDPATDAQSHVEPGTTFFKRLALTVIGWLPVEWLL
ncbi:phospholipase D family protein [Sulfitobacter sp. F26169L]|uniref:phospholipase D family protein n=1 Tax=Sulfitobacter sp. F26169L TaxID=2996015 RepID=UPI002260AB41|nr:phospholipase D family protein [Sulfitobacter sp. F26169L]MCX7567381.1 phospholipase D family protein [Sulfitobacter sp. F26169L]